MRASRARAPTRCSADARVDRACRLPARLSIGSLPFDRASRFFRRTPPRQRTFFRIVVAFDDNRLAPGALRQVRPEPLPLIEQRLGVEAIDARQLGDACAATPDALAHARLALDSLYAPPSDRRPPSSTRRRRWRAPHGCGERAPRLENMPTMEPRGGRLAMAQIGTRRKTVMARTPGAGRLHPCVRAQRAGLRHRPGRHRRDLSRRRHAAAMLSAASSTAWSCRARRSRQANDWVPARRRGGEGRSLSPPALRRALRHDARRGGRARPAVRGDRGRAAAFMRGRTLTNAASSSTRRRTPRRCRWRCF